MVLETVVIWSRTLVTVRGVKVMVVAVPALVREVTGAVVPSEKSRVPAVIWSLVLGRS